MKNPVLPSMNLILEVLQFAYQHVPIKIITSQTTIAHKLFLKDKVLYQTSKEVKPSQFSAKCKWYHHFRFFNTTISYYKISYFSNGLQIAGRLQLVDTMTFWFTIGSSLWDWTLTTTTSYTDSVYNKTCKEKFVIRFGG